MVDQVPHFESSENLASAQTMVAFAQHGDAFRVNKKTFNIQVENSLPDLTQLRPSYPVTLKCFFDDCGVILSPLRRLIRHPLLFPP